MTIFLFSDFLNRNLRKCLWRDHRDDAEMLMNVMIINTVRIATIKEVWVYLGDPAADDNFSGEKFSPVKCGAY